MHAANEHTRQQEQVIATSLGYLIMHLDTQTSNFSSFSSKSYCGKQFLVCCLRTCMGMMLDALIEAEWVEFVQGWPPAIFSLVGHGRFIVRARRRSMGAEQRSESRTHVNTCGRRDFKMTTAAQRKIYSGTTFPLIDQNDDAASSYWPVSMLWLMLLFRLSIQQSSLSKALKMFNFTEAKSQKSTRCALKGNSGTFKPRPYFWHEIRLSTHREQFGESQRPSEDI